jgi:hypothetical protein
MDAINPGSPTSGTTPNVATKDGCVTGDHDSSYRFGRRPNARAPFPFNERQFARLLILRGKMQDAPSDQDRPAA